MILQAAQQCSISYMVLQSFLGGWLSSLAFIINISVIGLIYRNWPTIKAWFSPKAEVLAK